MKVNSKTESFYFELKEGLNIYLNELKSKEMTILHNKTTIYEMLQQQFDLNKRKEQYVIELKDIFLINQYMLELSKQSVDDNNIINEDIDFLYYINDILITALVHYLEAYFNDLKIDFFAENCIEIKESQIELRNVLSALYPEKTVMGLYVFIDGIIDTGIEFTLSEESCENKVLLEQELYCLTKQINYYRLNNQYFDDTSAYNEISVDDITDKVLASIDNMCF